jgi:uroporphyrinogen-III synthase
VTRRVVVTRVQPQAQAWVRDLTQAGYQALALPLIDLVPSAAHQDLRQAWQDAMGWSAVMFVSAAAADGFVAAIGPDAVRAHGQNLDQAPRLWCTGPGTQAALIGHGFTAAAIDAPPSDSGQLDSEALWQQVCGQVQAGRRVLVVRGDDAPGAQADGVRRAGVGRDWLAQQLLGAGAEVEYVVAYERHLPVWTDAQRSQAQAAAEDGSIWLFSSAQGLRHLAQLLPGQSWHRARALCTHERIAQAARALGFGQVRSSTPRLQQVLASLEFDA